MRSEVERRPASQGHKRDVLQRLRESILQPILKIVLVSSAQEIEIQAQRLELRETDKFSYARERQTDSTEKDVFEGINLLFKGVHTVFHFDRMGDIALRVLLCVDELKPFECPRYAQQLEQLIALDIARNEL